MHSTHKFLAAYFGIKSSKTSHDLLVFLVFIDSNMDRIHAQPPKMYSATWNSRVIGVAEQQ